MCCLGFLGLLGVGGAVWALKVYLRVTAPQPVSLQETWPCTDVAHDKHVPWDGLDPVMSKRRKPIAFTTSGGGFRAMTLAMAFARAIGENDLWPKVTHMGTVSGSAWFSTMFVYSESFYLNVSGAKGSMDFGDYIDYWGQVYTDVMTSGTVPTFLAPHDSSCGRDIREALLDRVLPAVVNRNDGNMLNWLFYVTGMMQPFIYNISCATYQNTPRRGMKDLTLMEGLALPPDAWLIQKRKSKSYSLKMGGSTFNYSIPVGHVAGGIGRHFAGKWLLFPPKPLTLEGRELKLPSNPLITTVASGSSSAEGFMSSPTLREVSQNVPKGLVRCLPAGLQVLGTPDDGTWVPNKKRQLLGSTLPPYFMVDGGWGDVTGAAFTLGKLQDDCKHGLFDCSGEKKFMVIDHSRTGTAAQILFRKDGIAPGEPSTFAGNEGAPTGNLAMTPTIFDENYDTLKGWKVYNPAHLNNGTDARYWTGTLTTVDNQVYGVKGGDTFTVAIFLGCQELPTAVIPSGGRITGFLKDGSFLRAGNFSEIYRFANVHQQKALVPILKDFITG